MALHKQYELSHFSSCKQAKYSPQPVEPPLVDSRVAMHCGVIATVDARIKLST